MAEKSVSVRLSASVESYVQAMSAASAATRTFGATSQASLTKLGGQMQTAGRAMSVGITAPVVAAGAAAVSMSTSFSTAFSRMVGLAGVPAGEVDHLRESVLNLAGETGQAPVELANALYEAASAGLDSAQAMDAVDIAARAAAAGMGTAQDIVGLVASATASYGADVIDAATATDILTQTIREGRADPEELAGSLGRILPIAAQMGVSFAEVGGAVAYATNVMGDTDKAVTSINDALVKLANPTDSAKVALEAMGTSAEQLKAVLAEDGLTGALQLLRDHGFAGNAEAIGDLMPDMQGAAAMTLLLNDATGTLDETIGNVTDSTGALGEAFDTASQSQGFKMKQAWADIQVALIQVGDIIGPIVADIASGIGDIASAFSDLPGPVQKAIVVLAGLAAVAGPLLIVGGSLVKNWGLVSTAMSKVGSAGALAKTGLGVAAVGFVAFELNAMKARREAERFSEGLVELGEASDDALLGAFIQSMLEGYFATGSFAKGIEQIVDAQPGAIARMLEMEDASGALTTELLANGQSAEGAAEFIQTLRDALAAEAVEADNAAASSAAAAEVLSGTGGAASSAAGMVDLFASAAGRVGTVLVSAAAAAEPFSFSISGAAAAAEIAQAHVDGFTGALDRLIGQALTLQGSQDEIIAGFDEIQETTLRAIDGQDGFTLSMDANTEAGRANRAMFRDQASAILAGADAMIANGASVDETSAAILGQTGTLRDSLVQFGLTEAEASAYIATLGLTPDNIGTAVTIASEAAKAKAESYNAELDKVPPSKNTNVSVSGAGSAASAVLGVVNAINRLTDRTVTVTVQRRETGPNFTGGAQQYLARGGTAGPDGAIAGEAGPELARLGSYSTLLDRATFVPPGTVVTPMSSMSSMPAGASASSGVHIDNINVTVGSPGDVPGLRYQIRQEIAAAVGEAERS